MNKNKIRIRMTLFAISALISLSLMIFLGIKIYSYNSDNYHSLFNQYESAIQISTNDQLAYALDSYSSTALICGKMSTQNPVSFEEIDGEFISIVRYEEEHVSYMRKVGAKRLSGNTWSTKDAEFIHSNNVNLLGIEFPSDSFNFDYYEPINLENNLKNEYRKNSIYIEGNCLYISDTLRYRYEAIPSSLEGTFFVNIEDNTIVKCNEFSPNTTINDFLEDHPIRHQYITGIIFGVILWSFSLLCIVLILFIIFTRDLVY